MINKLMFFCKYTCFLYQKQIKRSFFCIFNNFD